MFSNKIVLNQSFRLLWRAIILLVLEIIATGSGGKLVILDPLLDSALADKNKASIVFSLANQRTSLEVKKCRGKKLAITGRSRH
jgi:hypothetical protein